MIYRIFTEDGRLIGECSEEVYADNTNEELVSYLDSLIMDGLKRDFDEN